MTAFLCDWTTFRLGGPCPHLIDCQSAPEVIAALLATRGDSPFVIGGGSNLLVADDGLPRPVIRYARNIAQPVIDGHLIRISACDALDEVSRITAEHGLDGLVACSGIPGTVGGAIVGNAGAYGEQVGDVLESIDVCSVDGRSRTLRRAELQFAYRSSSLQGSGWIVLSASFRLKPSDPALLIQRRTEILSLRRSRHPDWRTTGTAGSFFKNVEPTSAAGRRQSAGWFLEQAGALNLRVGGAHTYPTHANIVVADPGARARDVLELSRQMAAAVRERFGIELRREVQLVGFADDRG